MDSAKSYLRFFSFSYSGLVDQLEYEGFTTKEATYAVDNCGANWYEQAAKQAQGYMEIFSMSREELYDQLSFDGFTEPQIQYGLDAVGY